MELAFVEKGLRDLCASRAALDRRLGLASAEALRHRLADLRAASSIYDLVPQTPFPVDDSGGMALDVTQGVRVVFCANHRKPPLGEDGKIDWSRVSRLKIIKIEGTDD
jgi:hypothetical protein